MVQDHPNPKLQHQVLARLTEELLRLKQLRWMLCAQVQLAVENQMGKFPHQSVMTPSPAIRSEEKDASGLRIPGAPSQRVPTLPTEPTPDRMECTPKHSHELSCPQLVREWKATQRHMEEMERSLRAEICDLREEISANPLVALSGNSVP